MTTLTPISIFHWEIFGFWAGLSEGLSDGLVHWQNWQPPLPPRSNGGKEAPIPRISTLLPPSLLSLLWVVADSSTAVGCGQRTVVVEFVLFGTQWWWGPIFRGCRVAL